MQGELSRKDNKMEGMTNRQLVIVIKAIIQIIKDSDSKDEMIKKIEDLIK